MPFQTNWGSETIMYFLWHYENNCSAKEKKQACLSRKCFRPINLTSRHKTRIFGFSLISKVLSYILKLALWYFEVESCAGVAICIIKRPNDIQAARGFTRSIHLVSLRHFQGVCQLATGLKGLVQVWGDKHIFMTLTFLRGDFSP